MMHPLLYLVGYCVISVAQSDAVKFINGAAGVGLVYHDMGQSDGRRRFRLSPVACVRAARLCRVANIELRVESRRGLPYLLLGALRRPGLMVGIALFAFCLVFSQRVIWDIRIEGNSAVPDERIIETLSECGLEVGSSSSGLDIDGIENRFLIISDEISWITVNVRGTIAEVEVREVASAEPSPDYVSSNLVAARNGTIVEFFQVRGDIQVELGDDVSEGQLLVGGVYGSETSPLRFVRCRGQVFARCNRDFSIEVPLEYSKKVYTGRKKTKKSLIIFKKEVNFFGNSRNLYESCDTIEEVEYLDFFGLGKLPFGIRTVTYAEYVTETATRTEEQAAEQANYLLWSGFYADAPDAQLVGKQIQGELVGDRYVLTATLTTVENIAKEQEVEVQIVKSEDG